MAASTQAFENLRDDQNLKFLLWENNKESLARDHQRGLGGGLEYQIAQDFCQKIIPLFIEEISCHELYNEIAKGMQEWTKIQPAITFTKLDDSILTVEHPQNLEYLNYDQSELGLIKAKDVYPISTSLSTHGAEIDFHTIDSWDDVIQDIAFFAYADLIWGNKEVVDLLGQKRQSANLLSADIFFNTDPKICYFKQGTLLSLLSIPSRCKQVLRFSFVVTHEVGHTLGLDHISENKTVMGRASDREPIYHITQVDEYHLKRLYPSTLQDIAIRNSYEDEFMEDDEPDYMFYKE